MRHVDFSCFENIFSWLFVIIYSTNGKSPHFLMLPHFTTFYKKLPHFMWFSDVFREYRKRPVTWNGLTRRFISKKNSNGNEGSQQWKYLVSCFKNVQACKICIDLLSEPTYFSKHTKVDSDRVLLTVVGRIAFLKFEIVRSSRPEVFLGKGILKIYSKFTGEHPYWSVISIKLQSNFIEITLWHGCSPVNYLHIFRTPFLKNISGWLLLECRQILLLILTEFERINESSIFPEIIRSLTFFWWFQDR